MTDSKSEHISYTHLDPLTFRIYLSIRFDKPIDKEEFFGDLSTEAVTITSGGRTYTVDFAETRAGVDKENPDIVDFELKNPCGGEGNPELFRDIRELTFDALSKADAFGYGLYYEGDYKMVELVSGEFYDPYNVSGNTHYPFSEELKKNFELDCW